MRTRRVHPATTRKGNELTMKAVINGLRYDTETAERIGHASGGGYNMRDWHYWSEELYQTPRSKRFFLAGEGGALTRYAQHLSQNERCGGERIIPLSAEEAQEWAEQHLHADTVARYFTVEEA